MSDGYGYIFRQGLLHEINDIAILSANGLAVEMSNRGWRVVWWMWLYFPVGAFAAKRRNSDSACKWYNGVTNELY